MMRGVPESFMKEIISELDKVAAMNGQEKATESSSVDALEGCFPQGFGCAKTASKTPVGRINPVKAPADQAIPGSEAMEKLLKSLGYDVKVKVIPPEEMDDLDHYETPEEGLGEQPSSMNYSELCRKYSELNEKYLDLKDEYEALEVEYEDACHQYYEEHKKAIDSLKALSAAALLSVEELKHKTYEAFGA